MCCSFTRIEPVSGWPSPGEPGLFWLGQAGFWIETGDHRVLIDPYLSDSLAKKYAGAAYDHRRMAPPPIAIEDLPRPDIVLITHGHTDHMDPDTLGPLRAHFPDLFFVVPASRLDLARTRIGDGARLIGVDAGEQISPIKNLKITVFPAAHETLERDGEGRALFLGYGLCCPRFRLYHSGDCVPFDGLGALVAGFAPDIALLPVNGRDALRRAGGIPGNFFLKEAIALARGTPFLVVHHFGMFAFNTIDPVAIDAASLRTGGHPVLIRPRLGETLRMVK